MSFGPFGASTARSVAPSQVQRDDSTTARGAHGAEIHTGRVLAHDGSERIRYSTRAQSIPQTSDAKGARKALRVETRSRMTPFGRAMSEFLETRPQRVASLASKSELQLMESARRTSPLVNQAGRLSQVGGRGLLVVGAGISVYNVATAPEGERARAVTKEAGAWTGALALGAGGAKLGAVIGVVGGPVGAVIGAAIGGIVGGAAGAIGGTALADRAYQWWTGRK